MIKCTKWYQNLSVSTLLWLYNCCTFLITVLINIKLNNPYGTIFSTKTAIYTLGKSTKMIHTNCRLMYTMIRECTTGPFQAFPSGTGIQSCESPDIVMIASFIHPCPSRRSPTSILSATCRPPAGLPVLGLTSVTLAWPSGPDANTCGMDTKLFATHSPAASRRSMRMRRFSGGWKGGIRKETFCEWCSEWLVEEDGRNSSTLWISSPSCSQWSPQDIIMTSSWHHRVVIMTSSWHSLSQQFKFLEGQ